MKITTTLICEDENEISVLVINYSDDFFILFSFAFELDQSKNVNNRIVTCFHELKMINSECSFFSRKKMR